MGMRLVKRGFFYEVYVRAGGQHLQGFVNIFYPVAQVGTY
jgi:hypothetical protein